MKVDVFIKGCKSQLHWLCYNLQLLEKNWRTPGEFVVLLDHDCAEPIQRWGIERARYLFTDPWPDRYMHALWCKANADRYCFTDPIMLMDCDTMLTSPANIGDFIQDGRLIIETLPWHEADQNAFALWPRIVKQSTGMDLPVDFMVSRPWIFWQSTFAGARKLIEDHAQVPFDQAVYSTAQFDHIQYLEHPFTFCDLQTLGLYAYNFEGDRYLFRHLKQTSPFKDYWSHTSWTPELREQLNRALTYSSSPS